MGGRDGRRGLWCRRGGEGPQGGARRVEGSARATQGSWTGGWKACGRSATGCACTDRSRKGVDKAEEDVAPNSRRGRCMMEPAAGSQHLAGTKPDARAGL